MNVQEESQALLGELQRQARSAPRFKSQIQAASQRIDELEASLEQLQRENQRLAGMGAGSPEPRLSSVREDKHPARHDPAAGGGGGFDGYADAGLAETAVEQQLELAERQRDELQAYVDRLSQDNVRLMAEAEGLAAEVSAVPRQPCR